MNKDIITNAIEENLLNEDFNVYSLSETLHMDRVTLYRKTKRYFQKSPHTIIEDFRFNKAKEFLHRNDLLIKEIAYALGFNDVKYFSLRFRKKFGLTPNQYRASIKEEVLEC